MGRAFSISPHPWYPAQGLPGKEQECTTLQRAFSVQPHGSEASICTPTSKPQLSVVQAHLHLSISASGYSDCCLVPCQPKITASRTKQSFGDAGLACHSSVWSCGVFTCPLPSLWEAGNWAVILSLVLLCWMTLSKYKLKTLKRMANGFQPKWPL